MITDFDYTLSRFCDEQGERCWTTHGIFDFEVRQVSPELAEELEALRSKYVPIEYDPDMAIADKVPHMETWSVASGPPLLRHYCSSDFRWRTAHERIAKFGVTREMMERFVRDARVQFR